MALAILQLDHGNRDHLRLRFDIGQNRYYTVAVGKKAKRRENGIEIIEDLSYQSDLLGPLRDSALGRGILRVPGRVFDRAHRYAQLISYRSKAYDGFAISSPVRFTGSRPGARPVADLPPLAFAKESTMDTPSTHLKTIPLGFREVQADYSDAMFLNVLLGALPSILPTAGKLLGGLFGGSSKGGGGASSGGAGVNALLKAVGSPETIKQIAALIQQIATAKSMLETPPRAHSVWQRGYSEAKVAPALLAALPALIPILKQVLNPQMVQAVTNAGTKPVGMIIDGIKDFAKIGLEADKQEMQHLERLNPGVDDAGLDRLLAGLSLSLANDVEMKYKRVTRVRLNFAEVQTQKLYGRAKILYAAGRTLSFPLTLETPRPIRQGVLQLLVKDPDSLEIRFHRKYRVEQLTSGRLLTVPALDETDSQSLQAGTEYLVKAVLVWKNRQGKKRGTSITQQVTLAPTYLFDRVEESGEAIPLNDATQYRAFWHKIWGGRFTDERKRFVWDSKYYYRLNPQRSENARIETKTRVTKQERKKVVGQLKTGMELSPDDLNRLLLRLAPGQPPLDEDQLTALRSEDFADRFNQAARYQAKFRGRSGDSAALWVYPEFKLQNIVLARADQVNANGLITQFGEHRVKFPIPVLTHFIGVRTQ